MDVFTYIASLGLTPSDWVLMALIIPVGWFLVVYGVLTKWWVDPLGWFVLLMAISFAAILGLIIYALFADQRIGESWRLLIMVGLFISWTGKDLILHRERRTGMMEKRQPLEKTATGPISLRKD